MESVIICTPRSSSRSVVATRRQHGDHDRRPVVALAARPAEGVGLAVHRRLVVPNPSVVSAAQQDTVGAEECGADRYSALRQPLSSLVDGDVQHILRCHTAATSRVRSAAILERQNAR